MSFWPFLHVHCEDAIPRCCCCLDGRHVPRDADQLCLVTRVICCNADETVSSELKKQIMSARLAKKLTQAQLANLINEKPQVIQEYESGKVSCHTCLSWWC